MSNDTLEEKRRLEADMLRIRLAEKTGTLVPITYAEEVIRDVLEGVRQLLYWIPTEIEDKETSRKVKDSISKALRKLESRVTPN